MHLSKQFRALFLVLFISGCSNPLPQFENVDFEAWKKDKNGCQHLREPMAEPVKIQKEKFLSLTEDQIVNLMGKPDQNELYKRNQKFYSYFISSSPHCKNSNSEPKILTIRFNAIGLVKEVIFE